mgnify:CR=1 FL=1
MRSWSMMGNRDPQPKIEKPPLDDPPGVFYFQNSVTYQNALEKPTLN